MSRTTLIAAVLVVAAATAGVTTAASSTGVRVTPGETTVAASDAATFDVVVTDATGGVGAYNLTVALATPAAGRITDVALPGSPALDNVTFGPDHDRVRIRVVGRDSANTGDVPVASVTVTPTTDDGSTDVAVDVAVLSDEAGNEYTVTDVTPGRLAVGTQTTTTTDDTSTGDDTTGGDTSDSTGGAIDDTTTTTTTTGTTTATTTATTTSTTTQTTTTTTTTATTTTTTASTTATSTTTTQTTPATSTTASETPGFSALAGLVALAAAGLLGARRAD